MNDINFQEVAKIKVFGVGGGGCNAVNRMVDKEVRGVEFYVCNTDKQSLNTSNCTNKIPLGENLTKGLGAGGNPDVGTRAAEESEALIKEAMQGADMIFITAGMGGGTGTGAFPVFARIAKEVGALTIGIVTKPFVFEGKKRSEQAINGIDSLKKYVDSLIIISNNKVLEQWGNFPLEEAFVEVDNVLRQGVQTITDLIAVPALINLDFADIKNVMEEKGTALIGVGMAEGEDKAINAAKKAIESKLLEANISGASGAIINITGGSNITISDADKAISVVREAAGNDVDFIFGLAINEKLGDNVIVTIIATGFDHNKTYQHNVFSDIKIPEDKNTLKENNKFETNIPTFFRNNN